MNRRLLYWSFQIGGWSLYAAINILFIAWAGKVEIRQVFTHLLVAVFFIFSTHIFRAFIKEWGWLEKDISRLIPGFLGALLGLSILNLVYQISILEALNIFNFPGDFSPLFVVINLITLFILYFSWSLIYFMFHYVRRYNLSLKQEASKREIELKNLKSQLNPHFIFNALNSIRGLIDEDPGKSKNAVTMLSNILHNSLSSDQIRLSKFKDEINIVKDYLNLESIRYEERLKVEFYLHPDSYDFYIPPLMVQTLVENGIKHGISALKEGGTIKISSEVEKDQLIISIRNNGQYVNGSPHREIKGFGIQNTRQRLQLIYGNKASFEIKNEDDKTVLTQLHIPQSTEI